MKRKSFLILIISMIMVISIGCNNRKDNTNNNTDENSNVETPSLTYIGHATVKIKTKEGKVIYIDPAYAKGDYSEEADYILITHEHDDHNKVSLCKKNNDTVIIRSKDALKDGEYKTFEYGNVKIEAVPSGGNANHSVSNCVGYIVTVDGINVFHAGDTSMNEGTKKILGKDIDYAMYPIDGQYNMNASEASEVADLIGAKKNIPIHEFDSGDVKKSDDFNAKDKLVLKYGETIQLAK